MGDSGEGLVDAEARIQEKIEQLQRAREEARLPVIENPELLRKLESLKLARTELSRQLQIAVHPVRRNQLDNAIAEINRQIAEIENTAT